MANPIKGEVSFDAGGERFTLSYSTNSLCELEDELDMSVNQIGIMMGDPGRFRLSMMRKIFWAGLLDHHPDIDIKATGEVLKHVKPADAMELITRAFGLAFPGADEQTGGAVRPPEAPHQGGSGVNSLRPGRH